MQTQGPVRPWAVAGGLQRGCLPTPPHDSLSVSRFNPDGQGSVLQADIMRGPHAAVAEAGREVAREAINAMTRPEPPAADSSTCAGRTLPSRPPL